jgi:hypothetical protein
MDDRPEKRRDYVASFEFDEMTVITIRAEANPQATVKQRDPNAPATAPILSFEVDEMTEFTLKAIPAEPPNGKPSAEHEPPKESA